MVAHIYLENMIHLNFFSGNIVGPSIKMGRIWYTFNIHILVYIFSTKKNLGHFPRSTIYEQSNNLRTAYYEPPWYAHSTALPQSYPTSLLHLSDVLNLVQGSKTRLGGFCFCVASRLHYKNTSRMGFGFVVPEIYKLSPWSVSSGGLFRKII